MDPEYIKSVRGLLGLSQSELAARLRLGPNGGRTVRRWEAAEVQIPGPAQVALEALATGWLPGYPHVNADDVRRKEISCFLQRAVGLLEQTGNELQLALRKTDE